MSAQCWNLSFYFCCFETKEFRIPKSLFWLYTRAKGYGGLKIVRSSRSNDPRMYIIASVISEALEVWKFRLVSTSRFGVRMRMGDPDFCQVWIYRTNHISHFIVVPCLCFVTKNTQCVVNMIPQVFLKWRRRAELEDWGSPWHSVRLGVDPPLELRKWHTVNCTTIPFPMFVTNLYLQKKPSGWMVERFLVFCCCSQSIVYYKI